MTLRHAVEPSDHSLLRRLRNGQADAATQRYVRYVHRLHSLARHLLSRLASRVDADDIVQSVFPSFFRGVNQGFYDVPAGEELWKLLLVIALNKIRAQGTFHRAAKRDVRRRHGGHDDLDERARRRGAGRHRPGVPAAGHP